MNPTSDGPSKERKKWPGGDPGPALDAILRAQVTALAAELEQRAEMAQADQLPPADAHGKLLEERLDQKRRDLQEHLDNDEKLKQQLKALRAIVPPAPNEVRVRLLLIKGCVFDFGRLGRAARYERLDHTLQRARQILETQGDIAVVLGQSEVIVRENSTWELTPDELWRLGDLYASEGIPALLFADRIILPGKTVSDKTLPHSWGRSDRSIVCVTASEWLNGNDGLITAHNLAHLLGLDDDQSSQGLMSHDKMDTQLSSGVLETLEQRAAERATCWVKEHSAICQRAENVLERTQPALKLLEEQGDLLWQRYRTHMEKNKDTPAYGVTATPAWSDLAHQVERLDQQIARIEQELTMAKEMLAKVRSQLRAASSEGTANNKGNGES